MHIIGIDIGTYSIKFLESVKERNKTTHVAMKEVVLEQYIEQSATSVESLQTIQFEIINKYLKDIDSEYKLIINYPISKHTTRFLELPIKNKKKAELMIPFQLEEDIPYPLSDSHMSIVMTPSESGQSAMIEITPTEEFQSFFEQLNDHQIRADIISTESSLFATYFANTPASGSYMVLDLGHSSSKAYIYLNNQLLATHKSFIGGQTIDEAIASNYKIEADEAVMYKHQNCFFLVEQQYSDVDESQAKFARIMDKTLSPLIADITRWSLGHKVKYGLNIEHIYICGGTSNIKNIAPYLSEKTGSKIERYDFFQNVDLRDVDTDTKFKNRFVLANAMTTMFKNRKQLANFATGEFAPNNNEDIPIYSISYYLLRATAVCALLALFFVAENFLLNRDVKQLNRRIESIMKNPTFSFTPRERRSFASNPRSVLSKIKRKDKSISQEIKTIQSSLKIDALSPFVKLSQLIGNTPAKLMQLEIDDLGFTKAVFSHENIEELKKLETKILSLNLPGLFYELAQNTKTLKIEFTKVDS